ncbi:hypothetical protein L249_7125 [Ophiocordyceps polyrhachis-furcata BCC 54312]|uniref:HSF-type DNA-binding domain-containing protein n=1 Tax=Ophiocordyceps polyrhachis-furcata BCC 54312 TaxID=1330021 RepID=A0A367LA44_9HYPO|nr:hypothetical protein L249_7125 [Ophiocordyceps polyrhachis-furcata BCC 54312]
MSATNPRKRVAPGVSPILPIAQRTQQQYMAGSGVAKPLMRWNGTGEGSELIPDSGYQSQFGLSPARQQSPPDPPTSSTTLARRPQNQALVATNSQPGYENAVEPWTGFGDDSNALMQQNNTGEGVAEQENVEVLEEMASKAKRDAQQKRKQIPPFVQKLSSFLEERKNEDLIRWSENGDSFVVLDEDEFARTLIPELFKHNNYASFVRQLNMYGFHKRVGLSDNSMRASERKNKTPSEYYNPFFRRGHANLLWLINKPKGGSKAKKGGKQIEGDGESDEDNGHEDVTAQVLGNANIPGGRPPPAAETQPLHKKDMTLIREELSRMREQQKMILGHINRLQRDNNELFNQALIFQSQHDRHQNSINAILNFLANVFRKTLDDGSNQNVGDIISSLMTTGQNNQSSQQGSVFDLGDLVQSQVDPTASLGGTVKRARGLLPPIPSRTEDPGPSPTQKAQQYHPLATHNPEMGHVTELLDSADASPRLRQELETNPQERMMKIINDHNATSSPSVTLPEMTTAEMVANATRPLDRDQRKSLVDLMSKQALSASHGPAMANAKASSAGVTPQQAPASPVDGMAPPPSLSPILRSPTMVPPSLQQINSNRVDLDQLQQLQSEQDAKIHELSEMLGPLSPSGQIPGVGETFFESPSVDLEQYFESDDFLQGPGFNADGNDFNFNLDAAALGDPLAPSVESHLGQNFPSPSGTEEIQRDEDLAGFRSPNRDSKRRRMG